MRRAAIDLAWAVRDGKCAITDAGLAGLVLWFPSTATVNLRFCVKVTDGGLEAVAAGCPNLQHTNLSYCEKVAGGGGLAAVATTFSSLQHLDLGYCYQRRMGGSMRSLPDAPISGTSASADGTT